LDADFVFGTMDLLGEVFAPERRVLKRLADPVADGSDSAVVGTTTCGRSLAGSR
jgi:hypothetical protein